MVLSKMDRASRAHWQQAAANVRKRRSSYGLFGPGWATRTDLRFYFNCHLKRARTGEKGDPFFWA